MQRSKARARTLCGGTSGKADSRLNASVEFISSTLTKPIRQIRESKEKREADASLFFACVGLPVGLPEILLAS